MSDNFVSPVIDGCVAFGLTVGGWLLNGHRKRMEKIENNQTADHDALAAFQLEASQTYARESALKRIYDLIDEQNKDIKQILQKI